MRQETAVLVQEIRKESGAGDEKEGQELYRLQLPLVRQVAHDEQAQEKEKPK